MRGPILVIYGERVIEAVKAVHHGARRLNVSGEREFGGKVGATLARKARALAPKPRGGSVSPLEAVAEQILDLMLNSRT